MILPTHLENTKIEKDILYDFFWHVSGSADTGVHDTTEEAKRLVKR